MKLKVLPIKLLLLFSLCFLLSFALPPGKRKIHFPYKKAGLTERQAAAHLLSRFTFGPTPGQVDEVVKMGLEKWFEQQLTANLPDDSLLSKLSSYDALNLSNSEVLYKFPKGFIVQRMAIADSVINKDSINKGDQKVIKTLLDDYMKVKGFRPEQELFRQMISQKIVRAAYSQNQLKEVMTDFWFNHFYVSITKNECAQFIPSYERDVIRPNALGNFGDLLLASAKSPAMMLYLDNSNSVGANTNPDLPGNDQLKRLNSEKAKLLKDTSQKQVLLVKKLEDTRKIQGLNENYAREVMELHTLGVDGGYTQTDVTQAARVLTGWTLYPEGPDAKNNGIIKLENKIGEDKFREAGYVHDSDFLFAMNHHDNTEKTVLGKTFPANGGYEEGVAFLNMLAHHRSTAKFICRKLAVRFVSDTPSQDLVDKMAATFLSTNGDIKEVLITMITDPAFWQKEVVRAKTKSPFELAISAVRSLNADVEQPYQLFNLLDRMGEKIYYYQAPTGFPDKGVYWINTGSLLNRMNFGLALASQKIAGIKFNLLALNNNHEPESPSAALLTYGKIILPERDLSETIQRLTPLLTAPELVKKVNVAAAKNEVQPAPENKMDHNEMMMDVKKEYKPAEKIITIPPAKAPATNNLLSQVVGIIIGSPEFQRK